jgi:hypothetical protein
MSRVPLRLYALVAASMFLAFATAVSLSPGVATWLGSGLAAVAVTALVYGYLEWRQPQKEDAEVEEMFE